MTTVYRGFLEDLRLHVAIKRVSKGSRQGKKEYVSEPEDHKAAEAS